MRRNATTPPAFFFKHSHLAGEADAESRRLQAAANGTSHRRWVGNRPFALCTLAAAARAATWYFLDAQHVRLWQSGDGGIGQSE